MAQYMSPGGRAAQNIAHEFEAVMRTVAERIRRLPGTSEGASYAQRMREIANGALCCVQADQMTLVATPEELDAAEVALENARQALAASVDEFLALDILQAKIAEREPVPQVVVVDVAPRLAGAMPASG